MKHLTFLFSMISIMLSACGTSQLAPTATLAATNPPAPTATQTQIPTPTNTQTPTLTPTPEIPEVTVDFFKNVDWSDFVPVTHEERLALNDQFMNDPSQWKLPADPNSVARPIIFGVNVSPDGTSANLNCLLSVNCAPHYAVVESIPEGTLYIIIWELITKGSDGKNVRVSLSTAFTSDTIYKDWQLEQIRAISNYGDSAELNMHLVINMKVSDPSTTELARTLLVDDPARFAITKGTIDEQTADILVWTTLIGCKPY